MQRYTVTIGDDMMISSIKTELDIGDGWEVAMPPENSPVRYIFPGREYICIMSPNKKILFKIEKW